MKWYFFQVFCVAVLVEVAANRRSIDLFEIVSAYSAIAVDVKNGKPADRTKLSMLTSVVSKVKARLQPRETSLNLRASIDSCEPNIVNGLSACSILNGVNVSSTALAGIIDSTVYDTYLQSVVNGSGSPPLKASNTSACKSAMENYLCILLGGVCVANTVRPPCLQRCLDLYTYCYGYETLIGTDACLILAQYELSASANTDCFCGGVSPLSSYCSGECGVTTPCFSPTNGTSGSESSSGSYGAGSSSFSSSGSGSGSASGGSSSAEICCQGNYAAPFSVGDTQCPAPASGVLAAASASNFFGSCSAETSCQLYACNSSLGQLYGALCAPTSSNWLDSIQQVFAPHGFMCAAAAAPAQPTCAAPSETCCTRVLSNPSSSLRIALSSPAAALTSVTVWNDAPGSLPLLAADPGDAVLDGATVSIGSNSSITGCYFGRPSAVQPGRTGWPLVCGVRGGVVWVSFPGVAPAPPAPVRLAVRVCTVSGGDGPPPDAWLWIQQNTPGTISASGSVGSGASYSSGSEYSGSGSSSGSGAGPGSSSVGGNASGVYCCQGVYASSFLAGQTQCPSPPPVSIGSNSAGYCSPGLDCLLFTCSTELGTLYGGQCASPESPWLAGINQAASAYGVTCVALVGSSSGSGSGSGSSASSSSASSSSASGSGSVSGL